MFDRKNAEKVSEKQIKIKMNLYLKSIKLAMFDQNNSTRLNTD